jgi:hypothetical protein
MIDDLLNRKLTYIKLYKLIFIDQTTQTGALIVVNMTSFPNSNNTKCITAVMRELTTASLPDHSGISYHSQNHCKLSVAIMPFTTVAAEPSPDLFLPSF